MQEEPRGNTGKNMCIGISKYTEKFFFFFWCAHTPMNKKIQNVALSFMLFSLIFSYSNTFMTMRRTTFRTDRLGHKVAVTTDGDPSIIFLDRHGKYA